MLTCLQFRLAKELQPENKEFLLKVLLKAVTVSVKQCSLLADNKSRRHNNSTQQPRMQAFIPFSLLLNYLLK